MPIAKEMAVTNRYIGKNIVFRLFVSARDFMRQLQTYDISFLWHNEALNCKTDTWNRLLGPKNHTLDTIHDYIDKHKISMIYMLTLLCAGAANQTFRFFVAQGSRELQNKHLESTSGAKKPYIGHPI